MRQIWVVPLVLLLACGARTRPIPEGSTPPLPPDDNESMVSVRTYLAGLEPPVELEPTAIESVQLATVFPDYNFFAVGFAQFPVAHQPPEGLAAANVFAVGPGRTVRPISDREQLDAFFSERFPTTTQVEDSLATLAAHCYLELLEVLVQDGYYGFAGIDAQASAGEGLATVLVANGGTGELKVRLRFTGGFSAEVTSTLDAGPRPR